MPIITQTLAAIDNRRISASALANINTDAHLPQSRDSNGLVCAQLRCKRKGIATLKIGYARVSTDGQQLHAQIAQLQAAGCVRIFQEKISGARSDRKELQLLLASLTAGDEVVVTRLDRLARSTKDLLDILDRIQRLVQPSGLSRGNTNTAHGKLMLTVLGGLAEFERSLIHARTSEGRNRAKAEGVKFGRKPKLTTYQRAEAIKRREAGEPLKAIAKTYSVSHSTISRL